MGRRNIVKISILSETIFRLIVIHMKLPITFSIELEEITIICMETQNTLSSQSDLEKQGQSWG